MSDPEAKARRSKTKDAKQSPAPDETVIRRKNRDPKLIQVEWKLTDGAKGRGLFPAWGREWQRISKYRTQEDAEKAVAGFKKQSWYADTEFRITPIVKKGR